MTELRARVETDRIERTIWVEVLDGPVIEVTRSWHVKVRRIAVDLLFIEIVNGETVSITASGGMARVDGTISDLQRGRIEWRASVIDTCPDWIQRVWREAPAGVTVWRFPDAGAS